jgi:hypothetical protein
MTTEAIRQNWFRTTGAIALVACGWLAVVTALTFGSAPGKSMAIVGPSAEAFAIVASANGRVLAASNYVTFARSDDSDFVARLYAAGALLVLDAEQAGGCSGLPSSSLRAKAEAIHFLDRPNGLLRRFSPRNDERERIGRYDAYF